MKMVRSIASAATAAAVLAMASSPQAQPVSLTIASAINAQHTSSRAMDIFKTEVARRSNNAINVELAPGMKLGGDMEIIQKVRANTIFATWVATTFISRLVPEIEVMNIPFTFKNYNDAMRTIDGPVGKRIEAKLDAKGFVTLAWMELGAHNVMNAKRPLKSPGDFKSLRLRVEPTQSLLATFRALGATPEVVDTKDLYTALQQDDIDGLDLPYSIANGYLFYDKQRYLSDTDHMLDLVVLIANKRVFMRLAPEQQKAVRDAARIAAARQRKMAEKEEATALEELEAKGLQFDHVPPETRVALRKAAAGVVNRMKGQFGAGLVDKVVAAADRTDKR